MLWLVVVWSFWTGLNVSKAERGDAKTTLKLLGSARLTLALNRREEGRMGC
jgi:hypothetical protein